MERLDLLGAPLSGTNLIEAGAGTGKTYTITGLFLRLVLQAELPVDQILVVTYTKAATAELKERIRAKLIEMQGALIEGQSSDALIEPLLGQVENYHRWGQLLTRAVLDFDRAAIFTIHGFCQRVLADSAFESGAAYNTELLLEEGALLEEIVDDFWRIAIENSDELLLGYLLEQSVSQDVLMNFLRGKLSRPYLQIRGVSVEVDLNESEKRLREAFLEVRNAWQASAKQISDLLFDAPGLSRQKYRKDYLENWLRILEQYLANDPSEPFEQFNRFTTSYLKTALKKDGEPPEHLFFELCEALLIAAGERTEAYRKAYVKVQQRLLVYADQELSKRKRERRQQGYDDLLLNLEQALALDRSGKLVERVRTRYRAALIDEFQDTDPVQYQIFTRIYRGAEGPLYLVGDPKQAIYSFRGADIFAYLRAQELADKRYTLVTNWRSDPALISAINALFQGENSFLFQQITYHQAEPARRDRAELCDPTEEGGALRLHYLQAESSSRLLSKSDATDISAFDSAQEIARLLSGEVTLDKKPVVAGDIAVLVRSHRQGEVMQEVLRQFGVRSVQRSPANVFHSWEAEELGRLLQAIAQPGRAGLVRAALGTDLLGDKSADIAQLELEDRRMEQRQRLFLTSNRVWREQGFMPMFRQLLSAEAIAARLMGLEGGERRLTNLFHLAELLHGYERDGQCGMNQLISWLATQRQSERVEDETHQLRLESDANLVQIITVHKSKGLQYPIVFVPFGWDGGIRVGQYAGGYQFHDPADHFQSVLELGSDRYDDDLIHAQQEEMAEHIRLLYVALTRAKHRCYLYWGEVSGAEESAFAWLLMPFLDAACDFSTHRDDIKKSIKNKNIRDLIKVYSDSDFVSFQSVVSSRQSEFITQPAAEADNIAKNLQAREFPARSLLTSRVTSFSSLLHYPAGHYQVDSEFPDYDQLATPFQQELGRQAQDIFSFPKGALSGSCLHAIFEEIDFTHPNADELTYVVNAKLDEYGFSLNWEPTVAQTVKQVLATALDDDGFLLSKIANEQKLVELPFYFPLEEIEGAGLKRILKRHGYAITPMMERAVEQIAFSELSGYMKGFIDLVCEHNSRFYLIDYKSNWLGDQLEAYSQSSMADVVARERYFLQYLIYTVALHRYLAQRLPAYDYEQHFGAVFYLFLRGMSPEAGSTYGVFRDRPTLELIEELDRYLSTPGVSA